jgi:glycosyltransferase involved in cell wall biosynthesis
VGFTGILRPWHGLDLLVDAVGSMAAAGDPVFLLVVGDGPYRHKLESLLRASALGARWHITGRVPHDRVPDYIALFDVAVSPRATFYASPMKVIEYMALAKPVVTPRTPNFLDIVDEARDGLMFADGDAADLARVLTPLCRAPGMGHSLGANGRLKVELRLNWANNAARSCTLVGS